MWIGKVKLATPYMVYKGGRCLSRCLFMCDIGFFTKVFLWTLNVKLGLKQMIYMTQDSTDLLVSLPVTSVKKSYKYFSCYSAPFSYLFIHNVKQWTVFCADKFLYNRSLIITHEAYFPVAQVPSITALLLHYYNYIVFFCFYEELIL